MHRALIFSLAVVYWNFASATQPSEVLEPGYTLGGKSAADLAAEWWQWAFSSREEINPVRDTSGVYCSVGQQGKVWFLAGGFGSSRISRRCVIPSKKYIFFPVINNDKCFISSNPESGLWYDFPYSKNFKLGFRRFILYEMASKPENNKVCRRTDKSRLSGFKI